MDEEDLWLTRRDRIVAKLKVWGQGLFNAVFADRAAERLFNAFQDENVEGRQISIDSCCLPNALPRYIRLIIDCEIARLYVSLERCPLSQELKICTDR